ncbi:MAG: aspartate kinase [Anaerolineae bacterium]|nr:aspartate kinase [Thermoflexales bacterium]MDW8394686.1 aspartate kinase [Anaerolineae bacterium]
MSIAVLKFGGTSVSDAQAMRQVTHIVREAVSSYDHVVVVTSAMGKSPDPQDTVKVTDLLLNAARSAAGGDADTYQRTRRLLADKHHAAIDALVTNLDDRRDISNEVDDLLDGFEALCASVRVLGEVTPRALDTIAGLGERMAARVLAGALRSAGISAEAVDATELIVTNDRYQSASPLMDLTRERTRARLLPMLERGLVPVVTGFIGATQSGVPTTLGRGGSDYSASIIAAVLDADIVFNYTDVDGVLTTDPRIVPEARTIATLTAQEISEMAYFGASVLHPMTITPLIEKNIPLRVKNTFNPTHPGTLIVYQADASKADGAIKAITAIKNVSLITVAGSGMKGVPGIAARTFSTVARTGTSVLMISQASSEQSICFVVPRAAAANIVAALKETFQDEIAHREIDGVEAFDRASIITVVGAGISETPGVSGRVFGTLGEHHINVYAIAQGSSECAISFIVAEDRCDDAVRALHFLTQPC